MRLIWKTLGFLAVLIAVAAAGLFLLPADRWGRIASDQLSKQLGREVTLSDARLSIWPVLGVQAGGVRVGNADWAGEAPMFEATRASFGLDPVAAIQGRLEFRSIEAVSPILRLTTRGDQANWHFSAPQATTTTTTTSTTSEPAKPGFALTTLDRLSISDGRVILDTDGQISDYRNTDLSMRWPDTDGPLSFAITLSPAQSPITLSGSLQRPRTMMAGGAAPVSLSIHTPGGALDFAGLAGTAPEAQGELTIDLDNTAKAAAAFGQLGLTLPEGLGQSITGQMQITLTREGRLALRDAALSLDNNALELAADVTLGGKPRVNAQIRAAALDLSGLTGTDKGSGSDTNTSAAASDGWSTARIDASGLAAFDGEISLVTEALNLDPLSFGKTRALLSLDNSRASFELRELQGYGGLITGTFVANNRGGLSTRADLAFAGLALRDLLSDTMDVSRFSGPADGSVSLLASGNSVAALVGTLSGDGALRAGPGVIEGIDLTAALTGQATGGTTIFDQATGTFTIKDGVLRNNDLSMALPRLMARGDGRIDLGARSMDYLMTVLAPQARGGQGLSIPVRVKGPWSALTFRVDAAEALNANLAQEREALEQKARDKVNEAIQDKLGVTVGEGQKVEDALRQSIEERAKDGLLNLLNR
ncbi:AsmA family protein [Tropicibacter oceani]|uniref:AsmA family protein n=1 Tax=Tropicibacter oceani TaxID=3058420 RepID=A0ABY8QMB6_9RHOB|nr:AsmA family protein [Tropicibacter oceani]WGW05153.1 AsmA family protein [Tropicibacter oceani]